MNKPKIINTGNPIDESCATLDYKGLILVTAFERSEFHLYNTVSLKESIIEASIDKLLQQQAELTREETIKEVIELLESTIEKERYSGAPCALDKVIYFLNQKDNERN